MQYFIYPATMVMAYFLYWLAVSISFPYKLSTYIIGIAVAFFIAVLEWKRFFRKGWHPPKKEVVADLMFLLFVQVLLQFLLTIGVLRGLQGQEIGWNVWPHHWPLWVQTGAMLVGAEFFRYWLHRFAHVWMPLWRLHAVHHAPDKLYWLNTCRFHPLEKSIQFLFDSLPFIVLGVSEMVVGSYLVFYSVNGFYQHSNAQVKFGFLNYFISGPELHRWHHSKQMSEANSNYGNNLIIWDLVFGTWFLPRGKSVGDVGIEEDQYGGGFFQLMWAPFERRGRSK